MKKKLISVALCASMCFSSLGVFAEEVQAQTGSAVVETTSPSVEQSGNEQGTIDNKESEQKPEVTPQPQPQPTVANQEKESNNSFDEANVIQTGANIYGTISGYDDKDYYKFTIPANGKITVSVSTSSELQILDTSLYQEDSYGNTTSIFTFLSTQKGSVSTRTCRVPAGTYYLLLDKAYCMNYPEQYTIRVNYTNESTGNYEKEWNNTEETATTINLDQEMTGNLNYDAYKTGDKQDVDYYKLYVGKATKVRLRLTVPREKVSNGIYAKLIGNYKNGITLKSSKNPTVWSKEAELDAGIYTIKIGSNYSYEDYSAYDYKIMVETVKKQSQDKDKNNNWNQNNSDYDNDSDYDDDDYDDYYDDDYYDDYDDDYDDYDDYYLEDYSCEELLDMTLDEAMDLIDGRVKYRSQVLTSRVGVVRNTDRDYPREFYFDGKQGKRPTRKQLRRTLEGVYMAGEGIVVDDAELGMSISKFKREVGKSIRFKYRRELRQYEGHFRKYGIEFYVYANKRKIVKEVIAWN